MKRYYLRLAKELLLLYTAPRVPEALMSAIGSLISVAVTAVALTNFLGASYAASVTVALIVSAPSASGIYFVAWLPYALLSEAPVSRRRMTQLAELVGAVVALCVVPLEVALLLAAAVLLGVVKWQALSLTNLALLSIPPIFISRSINAMLPRLGPLLRSKLRLPAAYGPPATLEELASLIIDRVWTSLFMTALYALSPVYFTLSSLPPWLRAITIVMNPYALSIEAARNVVSGLPVPVESAAALAALSALWFAVHLATV